MMTLYSADNSALMQVTAVERDGSDLLVKGKVFGTMPMTAKLTPAETRKGLRMLGFKLIVFLVTLPFRRSAAAKKEGP